MPAILFPKGMTPQKIEDGSVFMFYNIKSADGKPNITRASDIMEYLTGSISIGNNKFPTGDAVSVLIQENTISPKKELNGNVAQFDSSGQLVSGGSFLDFKNQFLSNTSISFK